MIAIRWLHRFFGRSKPRIPDALWQSSVARLPFLQRLPQEDLARLKDLCETFLARKTITGAGGLEVSDAMAVLIVIQACLLVLNLTLDLYDDMAGIIVYPSGFIVPQSEVDEAGVMHEWREPLAGEAIVDGGAVVLSWEDVEDAASFAAGYNVVIHEFAHKIDMGRGGANGCPPFLAAYHRGLDVRAWQQVFAAAYDDFIQRVDALDRQLPQAFDPDDPAQAMHYDALFSGLPLDPYAATNPAEFFAVASEVFFVLPDRIATDYPQVYRLLARYYRQDPFVSYATN